MHDTATDPSAPHGTAVPSRPLRVAFAGTPEFAASALRAIHAAGFTVPLVLTQPDRPAGRGMKTVASAVKDVAQAAGIPVAQPVSLRLDGKYPADAAAAQEALRAARPDVLVVAAYGLLLPKWVLDLPVHGCINIHASLLPRWRGAAPIHRAIEAGDTESGVTIMQMDEGLDTGAMISCLRTAITAQDTTASLHDRLAEGGARAVVEALQQLAAVGSLPATPQPETGVTYAAKILKTEAALDWRADAQVLEWRIRAFDPFPGATAQMGETVVKIWAATAEPNAGAAAAGAPNAVAGQILAVDNAGVVVACGTGALRITVCQKPGGKRLPVQEFLAGFPLHAGQRFHLTGS